MFDKSITSVLLSGFVVSFLSFGNYLLFAQSPLTVVVSPSTVSAVAGTKVNVEIAVNVVGSGSFGAHTEFTVQVNPAISAKVQTHPLTPSVKISGGSRNFQVEGTPGGASSGAIRYEFELENNVQPGEYLISVEGAQGLQLLGKSMSSQVIRSNVARLVVTERLNTALPTAPPVDPPTTPPFTPTSTAVAPDPAQLVAYALMAGALLLIALGVIALRRPNSQEPSLAVTGQQINDLPLDVPRNQVSVPPVTSVQRLVPAIDDLPPVVFGAGEVMAELRDGSLSPPKQSVSPTPPIPQDLPPNPSVPEITIALFVTPTEIKGDGSASVLVQVRIERGPPDAYIQGVGIRWFDWTPCRRAPQIRNRTNDSAEFLFDWYWEDKTPTCEADAVVIIPSWPRKFYKPAPRRVTIKIHGANPQFRVNVSNSVVDGTGHDGIELTPRLELFGDPADSQEQFSVATAAALVAGKLFDHIEWINEPISNTKQARWIAPFMMQRPPDGGVNTELMVTGAWTGGPMWHRAGRPSFSPTGRNQLEQFIPANVKLENSVPICILGCVLHHQSMTPWFLPLPGTLLKMKGHLSRCDGGAMKSPFAAGAVRAKDACILLKIEDRTQGPLPQSRNGCKIPAGPQTSGMVRQVTVVVDEDAHFFTAGQLSPEEQTRRAASGISPGHGLNVVLANYSPASRMEPVHQGPLLYAIHVRDGLGEEIVGSEASRVVLKSLVLETGGLDFDMFEYRPQSFNVEVMNPHDSGVLVSYPYWENPLRLIWDFAVVDERGQPLASGNRVETLVQAPKHGTSYPLWIGRWRPNDKVDAYSLTEDDRQRSLSLRRKWHELSANFGHDQEALARFRTQQPGFEEPDSTSDDWVRSPWTDRALWMGLRLELRTAEGYLLGTSDREYNAVRTPPDMVWGDHTFRYVLAKLRLNLRDTIGRPCAKRQYQLVVCESTAESLGNQLTPVPGAEIAWLEGNTGDDGRLERIIVPDGEVARLKFLASPNAGSREAWCEFEIDLGGLRPVTESEGVRARLENLGLCPGDGKNTDQVTRAIQRLQSLWDKSPNGLLDDESRARLDRVHQTGDLTVTRAAP